MFRVAGLSKHVAALLLAVLSSSAFCQAPDLQAVARNLVQSAMVRSGDKVFISGSVRDEALMEHIAIETMKAGGHPLVSLASEKLLRRSFDEVPASFDVLTPAASLAIVQAFDVQIAIDFGEVEDVLAGVPQVRRAAREKAFEPVTEAFFKRGVRFVNLGNGQYPSSSLSRRLGLPQADLASAFWKGASTPAETLRRKGDALRVAFANAKVITLTHPNGTHLTFGVDAARGFVSDGSITPEKVRQGGAAVNTWLPAGELILPAALDTADGKVVIDKMLWEGQEVRGLTLTYSKGRLISMTATSKIDTLKARYEAAGGGKDRFGFIDIGINPETRLPVGTGRIVWTAPGAVTIGLGDNRGFGGTNASDFTLATQLGGATVKADATIVIENGALK
jgi:leucyl aminopeptidase (aminopeptidase T)